MIIKKVGTMDGLSFYCAEYSVYHITSPRGALRRTQATTELADERCKKQIECNHQATTSE